MDTDLAMRIKENNIAAADFVLMVNFCKQLESDPHAGIRDVAAHSIKEWQSLLRQKLEARRYLDLEKLGLSPDNIAGIAIFDKLRKLNESGDRHE